MFISCNIVSIDWAFSFLGRTADAVVNTKRHGHRSHHIDVTQNGRDFAENIIKWGKLVQTTAWRRATWRINGGPVKDGVVRWLRT